MMMLKSTFLINKDITYILDKEFEKFCVEAKIKGRVQTLYIVDMFLGWVHALFQILIKVIKRMLKFYKKILPLLYIMN